MNSKIGLVLLFISLTLTLIYGIDKLTSENPSNSALIRIGLSDTDSSTCKICEEGEMYYESGCKRCIQDGVVLTAHVSNERFYSVGWSNDNAMYYGDDNCDGIKKTKNIVANENNTYYIEISKNNLLLETKFYEDENFSDLEESLSMQMCSNPTNLQYIRISNEDGKPSGSGGKLSGSVDDIQILQKIDNKIISTFSTSFDECTNNTCEDTWDLHNPDRIFVNTKTDSLSFSSEVSGTHDYVHLKLNEKLSDSWLLKFKFHIDELEEHPRGKGILKLDPDLRQILLGLPAIIFPFIGYGITRNMESKSFGVIMIVIGILILGGILLSLYQTNSLVIDDKSDLTSTLNTNLSLGILAISVLIIILGIKRMKIFMKKEFSN